MRELETWDKKIVFFTSAVNPITSLNGFPEDAVAMWGGELFENYKRFFRTVGEPREKGRVIGDVENIFTKNPEVRFFITWEQLEKYVVGTGGGVRVRFEPK